MAKQKNTLKVSFDGFEGIDLQKAHSGKPSCADMVNFRIMPDGSLKKRCGFKPIFTTTQKVHAVWSGTLEGNFLCIAVVNNFVYSINLKDNTSKLIGNLSAGSSDISFFYYVDRLYLKDSISFYRVKPTTVAKIIGYVPLYGKDWPTGTPGEINEPLNLLHRKARISYRIPSSNTLMLPTREKVSQIYSVYRNGEKLASSSYSFDSNYNTINVSAVKAGDVFVANVLFEGALPDIVNLNSTFFYRMNSVKVYSDVKNSRVFWWSNNSTENLVFTTTNVSPESYAASEKEFSNHGALYIVPGTEFKIGNGKNKVKAMITHYDRLLIFTEEDVWMVDSTILSDEKAPIKSINSIAGSTASNGVAMACNDPVSIGKHTIFRWSADTDEFNQCNAYSISDGINGMLDESFFNNAMVFSNVYKNEIWFCDPNGDGTVWIYNVDKKYWFKYSGIVAKSFFDANGNVGFYDDNAIYVFSDELECDSDSAGNEREIVATYESGILDFDSSDKKRLLELEAIGDISTGSINIDLVCDNGESIQSFPTGSGDHKISKQRLSSGRFSNLKMRITSSGNSEERLHSIRLTANKKQ